ncbi:hypothetical protein D3C86_1266890 [compost metagenome]
MSFSASAVLAPIRSGKHSIPPSPKVNASGGVPQKMSSAVGLSTWRGNRSHIASTSRWKCIVPLGWPVVPLVKAIRQVSSAAVSQAVKVSGLPASAVSSASGPVPLK